MQYPAVSGARPDPPAVPGAHQDPPAVHVSGQDNSSTAAPVGGTNAELPSDTAREEAHPSRAEVARNPNSASADITVGKPPLYIQSLQRSLQLQHGHDNICFVGI